MRKRQVSPSDKDYTHSVWRHRYAKRIQNRLYYQNLDDIRLGRFIWFNNHVSDIFSYVVPITYSFFFLNLIIAGLTMSIYTILRSNGSTLQSHVIGCAVTLVCYWVFLLLAVLSYLVTTLCRKAEIGDNKGHMLRCMAIWLSLAGALAVSGTIVMTAVTGAAVVFKPLRLHNYWITAPLYTTELMILFPIGFTLSLIGLINRAVMIAIAITLSIISSILSKK